MPGFLGRLGRVLSGGDDELGRDDLLRRAVAGILALRSYGARGLEVFPAEVEVVATVAEGAVGPVRTFFAEAGFDREVEARLRNSLDNPRAVLPIRRYRVAAGEHTAVQVSECEARTRVAIRVSGGDRDGTVLPLPPGRPELRLGRGEWHGGDRKLRNDLVVSEADEFVSRRAARILVQGTSLQVEALDQKEFLSIERASGERVRPAASATGRATARSGDVIVLDDGGARNVRLLIEDSKEP